LRRRVFVIMDAGRREDRLSQYFNVFIVTLISLNVIAVVIESVKSIGHPHAGLIWNFEIFSVAVFTVEYALRLWTAPEKDNPAFHHPIWGRVRYIFTPMAIVDLIAIAPFFLIFLVEIDLRFMRVLRLLRVFKLTRYSSAMIMLLRVLRKEAQAFSAALFLLMILMILASSLLYLAEHEAQPEIFPDIPTAMYWAVITLATVGYGDVVPITPLGKLLSAMTAVLGVGMVALPAGLLASGFSEQMRLRREEYEDLVDVALEDGHLSHEDSSALDNIRAGLGLSEEEASEILRRAVRRGVQSSTCPHCGEVLTIESAEPLASPTEQG